MVKKTTKTKAHTKAKPARKPKVDGLAEENAPFLYEPSGTPDAIFKTADPTRTFDLTVSAVAARENFSELLNRVAYGKRRIVLTRRGKPLVCVIPMLDVDFIEELEDIVDGMAVDAAKKEWAKDGHKTYSIEEVAKKLGISLKRPDNVPR